MSSRAQSSRPRKRARRPAAAPVPAAAASSSANPGPVAEKPEKVENVELSPGGSSLDAPLGNGPATEPAKPATESQQCGICLDNVKEQGHLNVCSHVFCFECIMTWSKTANTCPVCKRSFTEIRPIGADGKRPKRRRACYKIKAKKQEWEPSREDLLSAAGLLNGEYASEDDESYDPEADLEADIDLFDQLAGLDGLHGADDLLLVDGDDDSSVQEVLPPDWLDLVDALSANAEFANLALDFAARIAARRTPGSILPPDLREAIRRPRRFGRFRR